MNTSGLNDNLTKSYNPLSSRKQPAVQQKSETPSQNSHDNIDVNLLEFKKNGAIKLSLENISQLNNYNGFIRVVKDRSEEISNIVQKAINNNTADEDIKTTSKEVSTKTNTTYNNERIFNRNLHIDIGNGKIIYINTSIKQPPLESLDNIYQVDQEIKKILKNINEIELKINAKVDKEVSSMDYVEAKEKKEFEHKRIDDFTYKTELYKNIVDSTAIQKELLWLLR